MNPTLDALIGRFREAQDTAVEALAKMPTVPRPTSGLDWAIKCAENGLYEIDRLNDVGFYAHGYGVELKIDGLTIDFDWGDNGESDGFDGWRLWKFCHENCPDISCTHSDVDEWLDDALKNGDLIKDGSLYYDPGRRAN